jgi:CRAL/TRIO domain
MSSTNPPPLPWLKGCSTAVADPIPPLNEYDDRPAVIPLISKHRSIIDQVRSELKLDPLYNKIKHDDLWILRFVLSHKRKVKAAVKAAKYTLVFRQEHYLDARDRRFVSPMEGFAGENLTRYMKFLSEDALIFALPDAQRGVVGFLHLGGFDQHELVKNVDEKDWLPCFLHFSEWTFQWQDYITRTTGRLTKSIRIIDASGLKMDESSGECSRRDGKVMGVMEDCYPQLLQTLFICNAPGWIEFFWRMIRPIMPSRVTSKMDFIDPNHREHELKHLLAYISLENLPARFGGKYGAWPVNFPLPSSTLEK